MPWEVAGEGRRKVASSLADRPSRLSSVSQSALRFSPVSSNSGIFGNLCSEPGQQVGWEPAALITTALHAVSAVRCPMRALAGSPATQTVLAKPLTKVPLRTSATGWSTATECMHSDHACMLDKLRMQGAYTLPSKTPFLGSFLHKYRYRVYLSSPFQHSLSIPVSIT